MLSASVAGLLSNGTPQARMASQSLALVGTASLFGVAAKHRSICESQVPPSVAVQRAHFAAKMFHAIVPSEFLHGPRLSPGYAIEIPKKAGRVRSISMLTSCGVKKILPIRKGIQSDENFLVKCKIDSLIT